jgi:hypothetical protein
LWVDASRFEYQDMEQHVWWYNTALLRMYAGQKDHTWRRYTHRRLCGVLLTVFDCPCLRLLHRYNWPCIKLLHRYNWPCLVALPSAFITWIISFITQNFCCPFMYNVEQNETSYNAGCSNWRSCRRNSICFKVTIWLIGKLILQSSFRVYKVLRVHSHFRISPTSVSGTDGSQASPSCAYVLCSWGLHAAVSNWLRQ